MRRALVTGGNRGIGRAIAAGLVAQGLDVTIGARDAASGAEAARAVGCSSVVLDVEHLALTDVGPFDVLVNNAGILDDVGFWDAGSNFERSLAVMTTGPYLLTRHLLTGMAERGYGRIVNLSSGWGSFSEGLGGAGAYAVAKAALNALTVRGAEEAPPGVKINAMCPGWVRTRMGGAGATRSPESGAETAIWLATLPKDGPTGGFFRDRQPIGW